MPVKHAAMPVDAASRFWDESDPPGALPSSPSAPGLTSATAATRLAADGPNLIAPTGQRSLIVRIGRRMLDPLVAILIVAAVISGMTGDRASLIIILVIVGISIGLDVMQEHGAEKAAEALRRSIAPKVSVWRDGTVQALPAAALVRGDVIDLAPGDIVPADGVVLASGAARVDEAILTGEPYPVDKRPGPSRAQSPADAYDALFGGTAVISGTARMLVAATGARTCLGAISTSLTTQEPPTAFERGLHKLGLMIVRLTLALVLFVLLSQVLFHRPVVESVMFAVALAVGLTPELLPMVMTVTLSRGAMRMARQKVIVKRLAAIHDLGAMDVFCTDKTGTLTEARITLAASVGIDGKDSPAVLSLALLNSRPAASSGNPLDAAGSGNPLDTAILASAKDAPAAGGEARLIAEVPFDFERRRSSVLIEQDGRRLLVTKGAPEGVLAQSDRAGTSPGGAPVPLDAALRAALDKAHEDRAGNGERLLGIAWKEMPPGATTISAADEQGLVFAGYCAFLDPPKASAGEAIARLRHLGIRVKIISGDAAPVVRHLAGAVGLDGHRVLTGDEIGHLSDAALKAEVRRVDLFARVSPDQKTRIIRALSHGGHTVGFLGDGINDAPAIRAADAGLSVDGATDVAREAADMILLSNDLGVVADGVAEGRRTYANIIKYVRMGTSSNFGNMLSMALASLVIPFLPMTAIQILLNNLLYDLSQSGIPFDNVDDAETRRPHNWNIRAIEKFSAFMGPLSSVFDIATFTLLLLVFRASAAEFRTAWFVESMVTQILVIFVIRTHGAPWRSRPHPALAASSLGALALALLLALGPWAGTFGFTALPAALLGSVIVLAAIYLTAAELLKRRALAP